MSREEIVIIVDEENNVVGAAPRWKMRAERLPHRAAYILVFDRAGRLFVQKRTTIKDVYPGYYDVAAGGVVLDGESYEESARRELAEELGIRRTAVVRHFDFFHRDDHIRVWGRVFSCRYDGRIVLQPEEIQSGAFTTVQQVLEMSTREAFTPDGLAALKRYLKDNSQQTGCDP